MFLLFFVKIDTGLMKVKLFYSHIGIILKDSVQRPSELYQRALVVPIRYILIFFELCLNFFFKFRKCHKLKKNSHLFSNN